MTNSKRRILFAFKSVPQFMHSLLFCALSFSLYGLCRADPPYNICSTSNVTNFIQNTPFQANLDNLLVALTSNASAIKTYNTSIGTDPNKADGQFLCYNYVAEGDCQNCIATASEDILKLCPNTSEAVVWEEICQLRYSSVRFFGHLNVSDNIPKYNMKNVSEPERFRSVVNKTLSGLTKQAAFNSSNGMYGTATVPFADAASTTIYALVQCTLDLSPDDCSTCLEVAIADTLGCCYFSRGARLYSRSCYLRYEFYAFYEGATESSDPRAAAGRRANKSVIIAIAIGSPILVATLLGSYLFFCFWRNQRDSRSSGKQVELQAEDNPNNKSIPNKILRRDSLNPQEFPYIDMETISAATDNFSDSNKLGQGGFGPVYKGVLADGQEVAVKRLSSWSEQGTDEFINEVLLIFKLQHKNLVRLLGFSVHEEEKLLIYEYMPNGSLDCFLFDPEKRAELDWKTRFNILNGVARGMLYLHQDSRLRIVHRDLKPSNVLLDSDMNPKISDFGMARIFGEGDGEATNTSKIVGTYGYMAPEFAMEGLYSIKSDVYSFGVLLLEIITGRKNAGFLVSRRAHSLLALAWQLWNEGKVLELMDPLLSDSCDADEFLRCMHIGLLCVQEDAYDRPTMSSVVLMLNSEMVAFSQPERPAFSVGRLTDEQRETCYNNLSINGLSISSPLPR